MAANARKDPVVIAIGTRYRAADGALRFCAETVEELFPNMAIFSWKTGITPRTSLCVAIYCDPGMLKHYDFRPLFAAVDAMLWRVTRGR